MQSFNDLCIVYALSKEANDILSEVKLPLQHLLSPICLREWSPINPYPALGQGFGATIYSLMSYIYLNLT